MPDRWEGQSVEGDSWWTEIEADCFHEDDGLVVAIWTENDEGDDTKPVQSLVQASPAQAREMAAALVRIADYVEKALASASAPEGQQR